MNAWTLFGISLVLLIVLIAIAVFIGRHGSIQKAVTSMKTAVASGSEDEKKKKRRSKILLIIGGILCFFTLFLIPGVRTLVIEQFWIVVVAIVLFVLAGVLNASIKKGESKAMGTILMILGCLLIVTAIWRTVESPSTKKERAFFERDRRLVMDGKYPPQAFYAYYACSDHDSQALRVWIEVASTSYFSPDEIRQQALSMKAAQGCLSQEEQELLRRVNSNSHQGLPSDVVMISDEIISLKWNQKLKVALTSEWSSPLRQPDGMKGVQHNRLNKSVKIDWRFNLSDEHIIECVEKLEKPKYDVEIIQYRISECNTAAPETIMMLVETPSRH